jgi:hypothetical protein
MANKLFDILFTSKIRYGLDVFAHRLKADQLRTINRIKNTYLRRVLALPKYTSTSALYALCKTSRVTEDLERAGCRFEPSLISRHLKEIQDKDNDYVAVGPAFELNGWRAALTSSLRRAVVGTTVHGFHNYICSSEKCYQIDINNCTCRLCNDLCNDRLHILDCIALTRKTLSERLEFVEKSAAAAQT